MSDTKTMLHFMRKYGEYRKVIPVELKNDKPAKTILYKVAN